MIVSHATAVRLPGSQVIPPECQDVQQALPERRAGELSPERRSAGRADRGAARGPERRLPDEQQHRLANLGLRAMTRHTACFEDLR